MKQERITDLIPKPEARIITKPDGETATVYTCIMCQDSGWMYVIKQPAGFHLPVSYNDLLKNPIRESELRKEKRLFVSRCDKCDYGRQFIPSLK